MNIKTGNVVSHTVLHEWGSGKVVEVSSLKATIQFSDGIIRKIASSHYTVLQPADPSSFVLAVDSIPAAKVKTAPKRLKKIKEVSVQ